MNIGSTEFIHRLFLNISTMDQCLQRSFKRTRTQECDVDEPLKRLKIDSVPSPTLHPAFLAAQAIPSPDQSLDASTTGRSEQPILKSFTITTKKNLEYSQINELLYAVHVMRHGDPEAKESWWENKDEDVMMQEDTGTDAPEYGSANAALRQAFLQRHHDQF